MGNLHTCRGRGRRVAKKFTHIITHINHNSLQHPASLWWLHRLLPGWDDLALTGPAGSVGLSEVGSPCIVGLTHPFLLIKATLRHPPVEIHIKNK